MTIDDLQYGAPRRGRSPQHSERTRRKLVHVRNLREALEASRELQVQQSLARKQISSNNRRQHALEERLLQYRSRLSAPSIIRGLLRSSQELTRIRANNCHLPRSSSESGCYERKVFRRCGFGTTKEGTLNVVVPKLQVTPSQNEDSGQASEQDSENGPVLTEVTNTHFLNVPAHTNRLDEHRVPWGCRRRTDTQTWNQLIEVGDLLFMPTCLQPSDSLRLEDVKPSQLRIYNSASKLGIAFVSQRTPVVPVVKSSTRNAAQEEVTPSFSSAVRRSITSSLAAEEEQQVLPEKPSDKVIIPLKASGSRLWDRRFSDVTSTSASQKPLLLLRRVQSDVGTLGRATCTECTQHSLRPPSKLKAIGAELSRTQNATQFFFPNVNLCS